MVKLMQTISKEKTLKVATDGYILYGGLVHCEMPMMTHF